MKTKHAQNCNVGIHIQVVTRHKSSEDKTCQDVDMEMCIKAQIYVLRRHHAQKKTNKTQ